MGAERDEPSATRELLLELLLVASGAGLLAWPMLANGFPLVFSDSAWYLAPVFEGRHHPGRAVGYSLFLELPLRLGGVEAVVLAQAAITSALVVRVSRAWSSRGLSLALLALCALLGLSGAAKYASWLMADVTTSWLFLAGTLAMLSGRIGDRALAALCGGVALLAHNSHLPLALATGVPLGAGALWLLPRGHPARRRGVAVALAALLALPLGVGVNRLVAGEPKAVRGTHLFLLNGFANTGVLQETLETYCPERDWTLCRHRETLASVEGTGEDWLLFRTERNPFARIGGWRSPEAEAIVQHAFLCCADSIAASTLLGAWRQFWSVDSHDGLSKDTTVPIAAHLPRWMPGRSAAFARSDQRRGERVRVLAHPLPERALHALLLGAAVLLAGIAWRRGDRRAAVLVAMLLLFLAANALICAFASTLHARYQGRVAWLAVLAAVWAAESAWAPETVRRGRGPLPAGGPPATSG